jgi:hypothetical protein
VQVVGKKDPFFLFFGATGNFEVRILNDGSLIHSKKTQGQGRCETKEEIDAVVSRIREFMASM